MCSIYNGGWTKIISYYNNSNSNTCAKIATTTYLPTESNTLINVIKQNGNLTHYQSGFYYTNSSPLGSALYYSNSNITAINLFENNYGIFVAGIKKLGSSINLTNFVNNTCYGLIYTYNGVNVCSYVIATRTGNFSLPYGLVNSSYITSNYILNIYSLVNNTQLVAAHDNAAHLMGALGISENSIVWGTFYKNSCKFSNQSIGCQFLNFSQKSNIASINIQNNFTKGIRLNSLNCEITFGAVPTPLNITIEPNSIKEINQTCTSIVVPTASVQTVYTLILNYTYNNVTRIVNGTLNVTNVA